VPADLKKVRTLITLSRERHECPLFSLLIYPARYKSDRFAFDRTRHTMTATTSTPEFGSGDRDDLDACFA